MKSQRECANKYCEDKGEYYDENSDTNEMYCFVHYMIIEKQRKVGRE